MLIPVSDENEDYAVPYVNVSIVLLCVAVFVYECNLSREEIIPFFRSFGFTSGDFFEKAAICAGGVCPEGVRLFAPYLAMPLWQKIIAVIKVFFNPFSHAWLQTITSTFMHAGWLHLAGNMLFLWIFGDNVEHVMGKLRYLLFFLLTGVLSQFTQTLVAGPVDIPCIGASGAISAVMGAYLVYYPRALINVYFVPMSFVLAGRMYEFESFRLRARTYLLSCLAMELLSGYMTWGSDYVRVAVWAHIGGYAFGFALAKIFRDPEMMYKEDADKAFGQAADNEYFLTFRGKAVHRRPLMEERFKTGRKGMGQPRRIFGWVKKQHAEPHRKKRHLRPNLSDIHETGQKEARRRKRLGSDWMRHDKE